MLLQEMISKYSRESCDLEGDIRYGLKHGHSKDILLTKLRKKKILYHYMNQCRSKIDIILHKKYAVEQLKITSLQIAAMKDTASVMKDFTNKNSIEKIEALKDTLDNLQDDIMQIDDCLNLPDEFDEDELTKELTELCETKTPVSTYTDVKFPEVPKNIDVKYVNLINA